MPEYQRPRRKLYTEHTVKLAAGDTVIASANDRRCGLLLSTDGSQMVVLYSFLGPIASASMGISQGPNTAPTYIPAEACEGVLTGEIHARGVGGNNVTIGEWFWDS